MTVKVQPVGIKQIEGRLGRLEEKHGMPTSQFLDLWRNGQLIETPDFHEWSRLAAIANHHMTERRTQ